MTASVISVVQTNTRAGNVALASPSVPPRVFVWTTLITLAVIGLRTVVAVHGLRAGGDAVARMAGGVPVDRSTRQADERRLLNVVDEMAIASGVTIPRVYVLPGEMAINAFAAGYAPNQAAIAVTEGALRQLTRAELQGVIGHEFSHVLNGDMRLNIQMIGVLAGILFVGEVGEFLMRSTSSRDSRESRNGIVLVGVALTVIGYIGLAFGRLIKAGIARQREFLADASSVQFTRNPDGIAGALAVIGGLGPGSLVQNRRAETLSHMFFANGVTIWFQSLFATHPPLPERIKRIDSRFVLGDYFARRQRTIAETAADVATAGMPAAAAAFAPTETAAASADAIARPSWAAAPRSGPATPRSAGAPPRPGTAVVASVGQPTPAHVDYAAKLLAALPDVVREAANDSATASALVVAFALDPDPLARKPQIAALERDGRGDLARRADALAGHVAALPAAFRLPVVSLALGALRELDPPARDALVRDVATCGAADQRETREEFILLAIVRAQLRPKAARPEPPKYRSILEVDVDARLALSVLAHAAEHDTAAAFTRGYEKLGLRGEPIAAEKIAFPNVAASLARLARLAPFVKRAFLEACVETVMADEQIKVAEAELLRAIAATLDCPMPPVLAAIDPTTLT
jgi:Zn-dependent protease with chaperone function